MHYSSKTARWLTQTLLGYAALITVSLWCPLGIHRILMRKRDWWHVPVSYIVLALGVVVWIATGRHGVGVLALLGGGAWWFSLLVTDLCTLWSWRWPFQSSPSEYLGALSRRLSLKTNASLFVIVAVSMLFLAHIA